jgi:membrane protease subunit HflK
VRYLGLGLVLAVVAYLGTGLTQVRPGERAVVRRFGRVLDHKPEAGLWIGLPWGMEKVDRVAVDLVRPVEIGLLPSQDDFAQATPPGQLLTGDHNLVNVRAIMHYTVRPDEVADFVVQQARVDGLIERTAEAALAEWVAGRIVDDILLHGKAELPRWLVAQTQERIEDYRLGVQLQGASIAVLAPPAEVTESFNDVTRAQTEIRSRVYQAEQDADRRLREADAERFRTEQLTAAYIGEQKVLAHADAESFEKRLAQYRRLKHENPDFLSSIWWDEMGRLFAQLKENGRIDLLDNHLGKDGLDITMFPPLPKKR